jgi:fibronectin type 3 domain-containing protein/C1A family cysteine protease
MTADEAVQLEHAGGVYVEGTDYNVIIDGHGTGLAPPTSSQYSDMVGNVQVTDLVLTRVSAPSSYDLSSQPFFPAVGNQGSQGSCAAWAMTYYDYGYLEARDNNWTDASTGNVAHLLSPAWTYNRVNHGVDHGTFMDNIGGVIRDWGVASLRTMPYVTTDLTSWGTEAAFREAPLHRAVGVSYISYGASYSTTAFTNVKNLIAANMPVTFAIDANQFASGLTNDNLIVADEYNSASMNHAQTIVGYDDSKTDGVHLDLGAFKVVNSWGKNWGNNGYYWISYDAMKKIGNNLHFTYITDKPAYQPSLLAIIELNSVITRESMITVGVGTIGGTDKFVPYFEKNYDSSVKAAFPSFMAVDVTDLLAKYQSGKTSFYLTLGMTNTAGTVSSFRIEQYQNGYPNAATQVSGQSSDVPKVNPGSVTVTLTPYATIAPATALDNVGLTLAGSGDALWSPQTRDSHSNGSAMQSGNVGNGGRSAIQTTVLGPSTVSFWWKTSTEMTDVVRFYVDSVNMANASGVTDWTQVSTEITSGNHMLKWEYGKDAAISSNQDLVLLDTISATAGNTIPTAPTALTTTADSSIHLNWSTPSNGGSALTSYRIYRGESSGAESYLTSVPTSSLVFIDTNATVNQNYYYQVTATNTIGESPRSNEATGKIPISAPSAPTSMVAVAGPTYVDLSWSSNGSNLAGFHLYRGTDVDGESLFQTLESQARSYRDSTVTAGTTYYYRVDAFNDLFSSSPSSEAFARIPIVPNAPTTLVATVSGSSVHLTWAAPSDDGGAPILSYKVYRGVSAGGEAASPIGTVGTSAYDDLTTTVGTRYYYLVKAVNAVGDSVTSNEAVARVPTVPSEPTFLTAVVPGAYVHLSWTAPADNGGAIITQYSIYRGAYSGAESPSSIGTAGTTSFDDGSAMVDTQYYYVVKACNSAGESASSNEASSQIVHAPEAPTSLTAGTSPGHVSLTWAAPLSNGGSTITSYKVFRGALADASKQVQIGIATTPSFDDTRTTVGQTYYYSVKAVNTAGDSVASNVISVLVKGLPGAPNALTTQNFNRSIVLTWSVPTSNGYSPITGYKVYRSEASGTETFLTTTNGTNFTDTGLVNGNAYYYRISAVNAMGEGALGDEVYDSPATVPAEPTVTVLSPSETVDLALSSWYSGISSIDGTQIYSETSGISIIVKSVL